MSSKEHVTKVFFEQSNQGYKPGKHAVWDAELDHFRPGPGSSQTSLTAYAQWLEVVAGTRTITDAADAKRIVSWVAAVEFAHKTSGPPPVHPAGEWEALVGKLPARHAIRAQHAISLGIIKARWAKCAMRGINGCTGRVLYNREAPSPEVACDVCGHNPHGGMKAVNAEAAATIKASLAPLAGEDPMLNALADSIAENLAPTGITSVEFK